MTTDARELVEKLRNDAVIYGTTNASLYSEAASTIESLSERIAVLEGEKRTVESQRRELQMLLVRYGDHGAIRKAGRNWPEARTAFDGRCLKCGGTHLGIPGDCDGPPTPSRPHPHARDMIA